MYDEFAEEELQKAYAFDGDEEDEEEEDDDEMEESEDLSPTDDEDMV